MPRFDTLTPIHKALRALVYEVGGDLQTTDFADELEAAGAAADLELALQLMRDHHTTEEVYFYPKLQPLEEQLVARDAGAARERGAVARRRGRGSQTGAGSGRGGCASSAGADLNCRFNELVAFYFEHLAEEEAKVLPATWRHFDDAQLMAIQGTIIAEMDPDVLFQWLGWMFKGLNRAELVGMLRGAKVGMPPEALEAVRGSARRPWSRRPGRSCASRPGCRTSRSSLGGRARATSAGRRRRAPPPTAAGARLRLGTRGERSDRAPGPRHVGLTASPSSRSTFWCCRRRGRELQLAGVRRPRGRRD